jgi:catechol 2,3-dioxygenase-like lactoylglutathione lyase family enzyme
MRTELLGIHHVTAIAGDPQRNLDFYTGILGLRLVKLTVNYDDPDTYHLYYGDASGNSGTILTFFPWPGAHKGRKGIGQATAASFTVPSGSLGFWRERLAGRGLEPTGPVRTFGEELLVFSDPDGLKLELVAGAGKPVEIGPTGGPVPEEHAIRGFHGVTLSEEGYERTASLLVEGLGFRLAGSSGNRFRFEAGPGGPGTLVYVLCLPSAPAGQVSVGTIHHVAWRTPDDAGQRDWRRTIAGLGCNVTPVIDRRYFRSIYFREPGGVLFEIATDPPGFAVDEPRERLGTHLMLPPGLEPLRGRIEMLLPRLRLPEAA